MGWEVGGWQNKQGPFEQVTQRCTTVCCSFTVARVMMPCSSSHQDTGGHQQWPLLDGLGVTETMGGKGLGEQQDSQGSAWLASLGSVVQHRQTERQQTDSIFRSSAVPVSKTSLQMGLLAGDVPHTGGRGAGGGTLA